MLDDSLKDYWTGLTYYRRANKTTQQNMLGGYLLLMATSHTNQKVCQRLQAFIEQEKIKAA